MLTVCSRDYSSALQLLDPFHCEPSALKAWEELLTFLYRLVSYMDPGYTAMDTGVERTLLVAIIRMDTKTWGFQRHSFDRGPKFTHEYWHELYSITNTSTGLSI